MSVVGRQVVRVLGICGLVVAATGHLSAQNPFTNPSRVSSYDLTFSNFNQFLDATIAYRIDYDVTTGSGVPVNVPAHFVNVKSLHTGFSVGSTGNVTVSSFLQGPNSYASPWSTPGGPGGLTYAYDTPLGADFVESWIVPGIHNGRYTLDFIGGGGGFAAPVTGVLFKLIVTINGNWSQFGTGKGQVEWFGYTGTGYVVDQLFTYNNGVTTLELSHDNWDLVSPNAAFRLYGQSVVPEPASMVLVATGLIGLGAMTRVRRRRRN